MARQEPGEPYYRISVDEAHQMLRKGDAVVVDVRRDDEWASGHVKNAIHIPVDSLPERIGELPKGKKLLFICAQGVRSGLAAEMAAAMGFSPDLLYNIEEGTQAWIDKKYPTSYGNQK